VKQYDVLGVSPSAELRVLILDDEIRGAQHHWVTDAAFPRGRSRLCEDEWGECQWCKRRDRQVWLGYCAVLHQPKKVRAILRVGPETALEILKVAGRQVTLRGLHLLLSSALEGKTARAIVEPLHEVNFGELPRPHNMRPTLCKVLGVERLPEMWTANHLRQEGGEL
jgi:hypothetical protein